MGILRKLIGLFFLIILLFALLKWKVLLVMINNSVTGMTKTPFQIGNSYVDEISQIPNFDGSVGPYKTMSFSGGFVQNPGTTPATAGTTQQKAFGAATLTRVDSNLSLTIENAVPPASSTLSFWLANTSSISDKTQYIDFGKVTPPYPLKTYHAGVPKAKINLATFKYLMMIDPVTFKIYAGTILQ